jgi:hypothetical protein
MTRYGHLVALAALLLAVPASAAIRPSFHLDDSAWKATHIVLATEGSAIDGKLEVIESWKGDLAPGSQVTVPALATFADEGRRQVHWFGMQDLPEPYVRSVTGAKMVLFLIRTGNPPQAGGSVPAPDLWRNASVSSSYGFDTSVAWIERGEAYTYKQIHNPGPTRLVHESSAIEMKLRIACLTMLQSELAVATRENDPIRVGQAFREALHLDLFIPAREAIASLGTMGSRSLPTLRSLLHDSTFLPWHSYVIAALSQLGGQAAAADLRGVIEEELSFWSKEAPGLKEGWWNAEPASPREFRREHYERLLQTLRCLPTPARASDRDGIVKIRNLWQATPALAEIGQGQVVKVCNALLEEPSSTHE